MRCFSCQQEVPLVAGKIGLRDECPSCHNDAHCCRNCEFYDAKAYNECHEPTAERVKEKDRANYCDYFQPSGKAQGQKNEKDALRAAAEALFKKNS